MPGERERDRVISTNFGCGERKPVQLPGYLACGRWEKRSASRGGSLFPRGRDPACVLVDPVGRDGVINNGAVGRSMAAGLRDSCFHSGRGKGVDREDTETARPADERGARL